MKKQRKRTAKKAAHQEPSIGWPDNPVVDEIRAIRAEMWREGGETVEGYFRLLRAKSEERARATEPRKRAAG